MNFKDIDNPSINMKNLNRLIRDVCNGEMHPGYPLDLYYINELINTFNSSLRILKRKRQELKRSNTLKLYQQCIELVTKWQLEGLTLDECAKRYNNEVMILFTNGQHLHMYLKRAKGKLKHPDLTLREINKLVKS